MPETTPQQRTRPRPGDELDLSVESLAHAQSQREKLVEAGVPVPAPPGLEFRDPWGNQVQVVDYREVQFTKDPEILRAMGLELEKGEKALGELRDRGLLPRR